MLTWAKALGGGGEVGKENNQHSWQKLSTGSAPFLPSTVRLCRVHACHCTLILAITAALALTPPRPMFVPSIE